MAYVTQTELTNRFAHLKAWADDNLDGNIDAAVVTECISLAAGTINQYASKQYTVPLTLSDAATAEMIKDIAGAIAGYKLATRIWDGPIPENMVNEYDRAIKWLESLGAGDFLLPGETVSGEAPTIGVVFAGDAALVTRETMDGL